MEVALLIALLTNHLLVANPVYQWMLYRFKFLNRKPINCLTCLSFWLCVIYVITTGASWLLPFASSFLAVLINKIYEALPTKIK